MTGTESWVVRQATVATPIGTMVAISDGRRLLLLEFEDAGDRVGHALRRRFARARIAAGDPLRIARSLARYFDGDVGVIDGIPVDGGGTPFQQRVWSALRRIRCGTTTTYGALAAAMGKPTAPRAVGHANGANPVSIIVPCHRLVGAAGQLVNYGGGLERKRWLLAHERAHATSLTPA